MDRLPDGVTHQTFTCYVLHKDDLVGFVAYSIYKQHKISFLAHEYQRTNASATQDRVDAFCAAYGNADQVTLLRNQAERLLGHMNAALVADKEIEITAKKDAELLKKLKEGPGWLDSIVKSLAGNITTAAVVAAVIFGGSVISNGFWETVGNWTGQDIKPKTKVEAATN